MKIQVLENEYIIGTTINLSFFRWLQLKLSGTAFYRYAKPFEYLEPFPFFICKCNRCKSYYVTRPHGQHDYLYPCSCTEKLTEYAQLDKEAKP